VLSDDSFASWIAAAKEQLEHAEAETPWLWLGPKGILRTRAPSDAGGTGSKPGLVMFTRNQFRHTAAHNGCRDGGEGIS